jgi:hypothetical protein
MTNTQPRFIETMVEWLNTKLAPPGVTVDAETPLFQMEIINPLRILDLIAWTERATGQRIPDREIRMENFCTVSRIAEVFAARGAPDGPRSGSRA